MFCVFFFKLSYIFITKTKGGIKSCHKVLYHVSTCFTSNSPLKQPHRGTPTANPYLQLGAGRVEINILYSF